MIDLTRLLKDWESVYKKGLLTFWLLLLLDERPYYPYEMSEAVKSVSQGSMTVDDNSVYRAINRFDAMGLVAGQIAETGIGPPRKYYRLTEHGRALLRQFIERDILVFQHPEVAERIRRVLQNDGEST